MKLNKIELLRLTILIEFGKMNLVPPEEWKDVDKIFEKIKEMNKKEENE